MIVLDTNVVSELIRAAPSAAVIRWVDDQQARDLHLSAITAAELRYGVARMPRGRRRTELVGAVVALLDEDFSGRILPFDAIAATHYAELVSGRESRGRPISMADGQIAAICRAQGATLATRDITGFADTQVNLVDPWRTGTE